jgi:alpha-tubulin suppressor-like RCC1 family protein
MISSQNLIDKICCTLTTGGLTPVQCCSAESALTILCQPVFSVANIAALPNATTYNGRMVYVTSEAKYYYAVQGVWSDDFSSVPHTVRCDIYTWGAATSGALGDNTTVNKSSPVSVVGGFDNWSSVTMGRNTGLGVRTSGTLWAWGCNDVGQLGDNTIVSKSSPVSVVGGFTDWLQADTNSEGAHVVALRQNGTIWAWGCNNCGQLGDCTIVSKSSPVSVVGGFTNWCQVSAGSCHSLAVRSNGTAWAWGSGLCGMLGDNTLVSKSSPVSVVGGFTDWCQISAACRNSLAVRTNGTLWAWGTNNAGQLGDNSIANKSSPVSVVGGFTNWCQVSASNLQSLGVRQNGTAWGWGSGASGRLGDNTIVSKSSPVSVVGGFTDWCQISAGVTHSLAVRQNGTAWAWGAATSGALGNNSTTDRSSPVSVVGGFITWAQVSAGCVQSMGRTITTVPLQSI